MSEMEKRDPRVEILASFLHDDYNRSNYPDGGPAIRKADGNDRCVKDANGNDIKGTRYRDIAQGCQTLDEAAEKIANRLYFDVPAHGDEKSPSELKQLLVSIKKNEIKNDLVDIANTQFSKLPPFWQTENRAAAGFLIALLEEKGIDYIKDEKNREELGHAIHEAWLERNDWAKNDDKLGVPFKDLSKEEQEKDLNQLKVLIDCYEKNPELQQLFVQENTKSLTPEEGLEKYYIHGVPSHEQPTVVNRLTIGMLNMKLRDAKKIQEESPEKLPEALEKIADFAEKYPLAGALLKNPINFKVHDVGNIPEMVQGIIDERNKEKKNDVGIAEDLRKNFVGNYLTERGKRDMPAAIANALNNIENGNCNEALEELHKGMMNSARKMVDVSLKRQDRADYLLPLDNALKEFDEEHKLYVNIISFMKDNGLSLGEGHGLSERNEALASCIKRRCEKGNLDYNDTVLFLASEDERLGNYLTQNKDQESEKSEKPPYAQGRGGNENNGNDKGLGR